MKNIEVYRRNKEVYREIGQRSIQVDTSGCKIQERTWCSRIKKLM